VQGFFVRAAPSRCTGRRSSRYNSQKVFKSCSHLSTRLAGTITITGSRESLLDFAAPLEERALEHRQLAELTASRRSCGNQVPHFVGFHPRKGADSGAEILREGANYGARRFARRCAALHQSALNCAVSNEKESPQVSTLCGLARR
jgi:hypothetical protein